MAAGTRKLPLGFSAFFAGLKVENYNKKTYAVSFIRVELWLDANSRTEVRETVKPTHNYDRREQV